MKIRILLVFSCLLFFASSFSQTAETVLNLPVDQFGGTYQALLCSPNDYATATTTKYPLLFFLHGSGESVPPLSTIFNNASAGGPAYFIEHGGWPVSFTNPADGKQYKFIVVSPQAANSSWSSSGPQLDQMVQYMVANYRVDVNRIYLTGLSAGGAGIVQYVDHLDANALPVTAPKYKPAAFVPMSQAFGTPTQAQTNVSVTDSVRAWGFGDPAGDVHGADTKAVIDEMNITKPGIGRFTSYTGGHCCWGTYYNPTYRETINGVSMNIYEWMLQFTRGSVTAIPAPTANAGSNQTITLPVALVSLTGSGTAAAGHTITAYAWSEVSGPLGITIALPASASTTVLGLIAGSYNMQLKVTQDDGQTATSNMTITVNPLLGPPVVTASAGSNQSITLPTSSLTLSGSASTGTITSYAWTKVSGPNTPTIGSASSVSTTVSGLIAGSYVFQLSVNGGASTSQVTVTVNPAPVVTSGACGGSRKYLSPDPGDSSIYIDYGTTPSVLTFHPGDTICFKSGQGFGEVEFHGLTGTAACPIVVTNEGGQAFLKGFFKFYGAKYVHVDGSGAAGVKYGFKVQPDPNIIDGSTRDGIGLQITERSKCVEVNGIFINHTVFGMAIKQSPDCADSLNYPNWVMDSITIHDNYIRQVNLEGMYIGDTSPDNGPTSGDPRYVIGCHLPAVLDTIYPRPIRSGHMKIYNNIIDSTGRGGIQLSGHSVGIAEIYNNTLTHDGMNGDEQQGTGISIGMYSHAYIHDNTIRDNLTWGIASLGGSGTGVPLRIENNTMDSCGYLYHYNNVNEQIWPVTPAMPVVSPSSGPNNYDFAIPIFVKTATNMDKDSTQFWIKGNKIGKYRAELVKLYPSDSGSIQVYDYAATPMFQKQGNIVCGNTRLDGISPASVYVDAGIQFTSNCTITTPVAFAGNAQTITLPTNFVTLSGTGVAGSGHTITGYGWTKISGGAATITSPAAAGTTVTGLVQGVYVFRLTVTQDDGQMATSDVTITVNATAVNQPPVATVGANLVITLPVNTVTLIGNGTDADGTIASYAWIQVTGPSASTIVTAGQATTVVNNLIQGTYTFKLTVTDNKGATGTATITVTVNPAVVVIPPANQPPVANAGTNQTITLPVNTAALSGSGTDPDGTVASYAWTQVSGPSVSAIGTAGQASTAVNNLVQGVYTYKLTVTDNKGATATSTVTVTVNAAANQPPVANAGTNLTITLPVNTATLTGSGTDADGTVASYAWTQVSGPSTATILTAGQASTVVNNLVQGVYTFKLTVTDNKGATGTATMTVTVNAAPNQPPVANAGTNQTITLPVNTAILTGSGTDADGTIAAYAWTQVSGPSTATIVTPGQVQTMVNNLVQGVYTFKLTVTDNKGATATSTMTVTVNAALPPPNQPPVANAGTNQNITLPVNTVTLTGSGTDADGTVVSYAWTQLSGPSTATIATAGQAQTTVNNLVQGVYNFQLTVTDNQGAIGTDAVTVTVNAALPPPNQPPVANAGSNLTITLPINTATLTGSGTDADGSVVSYAWTQLSGPSTATIVTAGQAQTVVNALVQGTYSFKLTITDNQGATGTAIISVTVNPAGPANQPPVANAGSNLTITLPANTVSLTGSGTDADGTIVSYAWTQLSGPSAATIATAGQAQTAVNNLVQGTYTFQLVVSDNQGATDAAMVTVTVNAAIPPPNQPPVANTGSNQTITLPVNTATLTGSGTDPDGTIASYLWTEVSGPSTATIATALQAQTVVNTLVQGVYTFKLKVTDNQGATGTATVTVTVNAAIPPPPLNKVPVAVAGPDQMVTAPVISVDLDGSASYDPDGTIATYSWIELSGAGGVTLANAGSVKTTVFGLQPGAYIFQLTVTDNQGATATSTVTITVLAPPPVTPPVTPPPTSNEVVVAVAGNDTTIAYPSSEALLDGSRSYAQGGSIVSYAWSQVSGPTESVIASSSSAVTNVDQLAVGDYVFALTVTDDQNGTATDTVHIKVANTLRYTSKAQIYPNPVFNGQVTVDLLNSARGKVVITLHAIDGRMAQEFVFDKSNDEFQQLLSLPSLSSGVYIMQVSFTGGYQPLVFKMVKQQ